MSKAPTVQGSPGGPATRRAPIADQVGRLAADLAVLPALRRAGDPRGRGAALAVAHGALILAVTPALTEGDRRRRDEALVAVFPALAGAGLGHIEPLVRAALAVGADPASVARGVERPQ